MHTTTSSVYRMPPAQRAPWHGTPTRKHGGATGQHDVVVQVLPDVHVALHDGVEGGIVDAHSLHAHHVGVEQHLRAAEALIANGDGLRVASDRMFVLKLWRL